MDIAIALVCAQIFITLLFMPIGVKIKGHFSLDLEKAQFDVKIAGITLIRLRLSVNEGKAVTKVNGKLIKKRAEKAAKKPTKSGFNTVRAALESGIAVKGELLALVGGDDAMMSSIAAGVVAAILAPFANKYRIFASCGGDRCEIDGYIGAKVNIVQLASII